MEPIVKSQQNVLELLREAGNAFYASQLKKAYCYSISTANDFLL